MKDDDVDLWLSIPFGFALARIGSDSRLVGLEPSVPLLGGSLLSLATLSIVLKAFSLSLKLLSGSIRRTGVCSLSDLDSSKLASFSRILFEISAETRLAGWTKVSIFSSQASTVTAASLLVASTDGLEDDGAGLMELVEAEWEREEAGDERSLVTGFESEEDPLLSADLAKDL